MSLELDRKYFDCACFSSDHAISLEYYVDTDDPEDSEVIISVQLIQWRPWYKRVWAAIKYIFGYRCKYGHWDSFIVHPGENLDDIIGFLMEAKNASKKNKPKRTTQTVQ